MSKTLSRLAEKQLYLTAVLRIIEILNNRRDQPDLSCFSAVKSAADIMHLMQKHFESAIVKYIHFLNSITNPVLVILVTACDHCAFVP